MAARNWATSIITAIGVAAVAGTAQLGLAGGLLVISWHTKLVTDPTLSATVWVNNLAWVAWLAANSTVLGALCADRLSNIGSPAGSAGESMAAKAVTGAWRAIIALSAAVGSLVIVPLVAIPTQSPRPDNVWPFFTVGGYAVAGVIIGLIVAIGALSARAVAANIFASTAWIWALAVVAIVDALRGGKDDPSGSAQLATWQFITVHWRNIFNLPAALLMLTVALVIGFLAAWPAGRRGDNRVGVAISGAAGPLLVAAAYFLAGPSLGTRDQQLSAFVIAPYAVLAGLAGSVLVSAIGPKGARSVRRETNAAARKARVDAEMAEWSRALAETDHTHMDPERTLDVEELKATRSGAPIEAGAPIESDAYAPARAYSGGGDQDGLAYASDPVEPAAAAAPAPAPATGRATVKEPLWPDQAKAAAPPSPQSKGKPRRGKGANDSTG